MADEDPPPNDEVFGDAEEDDDDEDDEEGDDQPRLLERIASNDPALSTLILTTFFDLGEPKLGEDEDEASLMGWWGDFSISDLGSEDGDAERIRLCERHLDEAIEAVGSNTSIKHVKIGGFFRYELQTTLPWDKTLALIKALSRLPLETFAIEDQHQCCLSELIGVFDSDKLQRVKINPLNVEGSDRISLLADKLRDHPSLKELSLNMNFEPPIQNDYLLKQTYVVDLLFESLASIPNLDQLELTCNALYTTNAAEPIQKLLRHPKLLMLSLRGLLPNNHMFCKVVADTLGESKGNLEIIDLSFPLVISNPTWKHSSSHWFTQDMAEMLFSLVEKQPSLKVKVSCFFSIWESKRLILNNQSDANWYLQKAEVLRGVRLEKAGMRNLLVSKDGGSKAAWVDLLTRVSGDAQAAFHVLKEQPSICDGTKAGNEKIAEGLAGSRTPGNSRYQAKPKLKRRRLGSS